jgi:hypothetical protein
MRSKLKYVAFGVALAPLVAIAIVVAAELAYGPMMP